MKLSKVDIVQLQGVLKKKEINHTDDIMIQSAKNNYRIIDLLDAIVDLGMSATSQNSKEKYVSNILLSISMIINAGTALNDLLPNDMGDRITELCTKFGQFIIDNDITDDSVLVKNLKDLKKDIIDNVLCVGAGELKKMRHVKKQKKQNQKMLLKKKRCSRYK